jgi:hypothetical protein
MSSSYQKFAGVCGILAGIAGLVYLVTYIVLLQPAALAPNLALMLVGILSSATLVAVYLHVREVDEGFALWGLVLALGGAAGAVIHSAFTLNNILHPPQTPFGYANPVDPRGLLTWGVAGLAAIVLSWLIVRGSTWPRVLGYMGIAAGVLLVLLYITYSIIVSIVNPAVYVFFLGSGIVQPLWFLWLGWHLWRGEAHLPVTNAMTSTH